MLSNHFPHEHRFGAQVCAGILFTAVLIALARTGFHAGHALATHTALFR